MHCESGDILVRDATLAEPAVGDVLVTPATGAYGYAMANNYNGVPRPPVDLLPRRRGPGRRPPRDLRGPDRARCLSPSPKPVRIGLLGRGTVGGAFAELLAERADAVEAATGRRPEISGVLHPLRGGLRRDPRRLRPDRRADGRHRPRPRVRARRAAGRQAGGHRQQAAARPARRRALRGRPRGRRAAALRGGGRRR